MSRFDVSQAAPHELLPACRLLFARSGAADRDQFVERCHDRLLSDGEASRIFVARESGRLRAAALVQTLPGALGIALPPRGHSRQFEDAVTAAACAWLRERGVKVCQAFAAQNERDEMAPLERHGFKHTTQLVFLRHSGTRTKSSAQPTPRLTFAFSAPPLVDHMEDTLLATHIDSLDCPELNRPRTAAEIMRGFAETPHSEWYLATRGDEHVGLAIIEPGAEGAIDLTYLGIEPTKRGRGFGSELLNFVITSVAYSGPLNVSVDARNAPAMRLYARHGFAEYDRREVWLASWSI
ncbi:GNAT family N-acetyltransferase [Gemmata sp. G18]|uniref:GNAT family N-acetyltransferase n=1 Tax=Gemmata palustris TaxID=2822762 RepID=A0ABS5BY06_9BACT|nr:GNAT family N-acetyltransferase [Gemmata palustris]MBP3958627.1 GNAT family N-acetyltransferase [Gemmata palustris]